MSKSSVATTLTTVMALTTGLLRGYTFKQNGIKRLTTVNEIIIADNNYEPIYVYKPDGELAYIQNERKKDGEK